MANYGKVRHGKVRYSKVLITNILAIFLLSASLALPQLASAQSIPPYINYQGRLVDQATGAPVNETKTITFSLYALATGGTPVYQQTQQVNIINGAFSVYLGKGGGDYQGGTVTDGIPTEVFNEHSVRYLGIKIADSPTEMSPRQLIASVAYAYMAIRADEAHDSEKVGGLSPDQLVRNDTDNTIQGNLTVKDGLNLTDAAGGFAISIKAANQEIKVGNNKVWHEGNMGSGSGLNADLLDGHDSAALMASKGCYVSYSGGCLAGFKNMGSAGSWGRCSYGGGNPYFSNFFYPPGGGCPEGWSGTSSGTAAYVCCQ